MTDTSQDSSLHHARSDWIRVRTFIVLRWIAIAGQTTAITIAVRYFDLLLDLGLCFLAIGASAIVNLVAMFVYPENKRLTEVQAALMQLFDISQIAVLIFLTGGLNNPFALLILAPVTISATVLQLRSAIALGIAAIMLTTFVAFYHVPLQTAQGVVLELPQIFIFGFWTSIVIGTVFLGVYAQRVTTEMHSMAEALLATQMALSREQKLTDLGGVVAAAAHELGTPLATIKLASTELVDELGDTPALMDDAMLIREQAERCHEILRSMGRAGKDDLHLRIAPVSALIEESAEPHLNRGKTVHMDFRAARSASKTTQPVIRRQPEIIHGLRNLIQNAVDFADQQVWIDAIWSDDTITIRITDDGPGFPPHLIGRVGAPFISTRREDQDRTKRPEYEGMGLGLFIAKTLLERSGAELSFANGSDPFLTGDERPERCGAIAELVWQRKTIDCATRGEAAALGENQPNII